MIKMSITSIKKSMSYERGSLDWKNIFTTNGYAYALGLDIPQSDICKYAYYLGVISRTIDSDEIVDFKLLNGNKKYFEYDLLSDFDALGLDVEESNKPGLICDDLHTYPGRYFDILFFVGKSNNDFHFARYGKDGKLYHKRGIFPPEETTVDYIKSVGYEFIKRYRLYLSRR